MAEQLIVVQHVVGSSPIIHPFHQSQHTSVGFFVVERFIQQEGE